jgi:hypothetical protein
MRKPGELFRIPWDLDRTRVHVKDLSAGIWASFWLLVLTHGEPDLLEALVDLVEVRKFYQWILGHQAELRVMMEAQEVFIPWIFANQTIQNATRYLAMTDDELERQVEGSELHPFTGG